jgi:hypothetical protein
MRESTRPGKKIGIYRNLLDVTNKKRIFLVTGL